MVGCFLRLIRFSGQIEIINPVQLITKGTKVGSSEAALLQKLKIRPFTYGLEITAVYDQGLCYDAEILEMTSDGTACGIFVCLRLAFSNIVSCRFGCLVHAGCP